MKMRIVIQAGAGVVCTLFFLALALHHVPSGAVVATLGSVDPLWVAAALLCYAVDLGVRAGRWQIILRPTAVLPYRAVAKSLLVGYGLNVILPARLGELFRAEYCNKTYGLARTCALTSIVIERLFDGLAVVGFLGIGLLLTVFTRQPSGALVGILAMASAIFGAAFLAALCPPGR